MHPYHHALSSQREYGGTVDDYLPLHNWFDASKTALAHFTHRALHHHREGVAEAVQLFGAEIRNADGARVSVEQLSLQHLKEDMSTIPNAADWLEHLDPAAIPLPAIFPRTGHQITLEHLAQLAERGAVRFQTTPEALLPLHLWFLETATWFTDARHFAMRHHSFGIFQAERRFGVLLTQEPSPLPTRIVAEWHVRAILGRIPAAADYLRKIRGQSWMAAAQNPRRLGLIQSASADIAAP
jgi:hypothetical protein